jgi:hypothetical protein
VARQCTLAGTTAVHETRKSHLLSQLSLIDQLQLGAALCYSLLPSPALIMLSAPATAWPVAGRTPPTFVACRGVRHTTPSRAEAAPVNQLLAVPHHTTQLAQNTHRHPTGLAPGFGHCRLCYSASYSFRMWSREAGQCVTGQQCCSLTCLNRQG